LNTDTYGDVVTFEISTNQEHVLKLELYLVLVGLR